MWEPNDHKSYEWEVPPSNGTLVGAIAIAEESMGGGQAMKIRMGLDDPLSGPTPVIYEHAILASGLRPDNTTRRYLLHQWEATSYGTRLRSTMHFLVPPPDPGYGEKFTKHCKSEFGNFSNFLPEFYKLWKVVKDPAINRQGSCRVRK